MKWLAISTYAALSIASGAGFWMMKGNKDHGGVRIEPKGRDAAIIMAIKGAKKSVLVRTERFELCEMATVLVNLPPKGIAVTVEVPETAALRAKEDAFRGILAKEGVSWKIGSEPEDAYRGTLVVVDGRTLIYSGSPITYAAPGTLRPYVIGEMEEGQNGIN